MGAAPGTREYGGLADRLSRIEKRLADLERGNRLPSASVGSGGLTIRDAGALRLLDTAGNVLVTLDADGLHGYASVMPDTLTEAEAVDETPVRVSRFYCPLHPRHLVVPAVVWTSAADTTGQLRFYVYYEKGGAALYSLVHEESFDYATDGFMPYWYTQFVEFDLPDGAAYYKSTLPKISCSVCRLAGTGTVKAMTPTVVSVVGDSVS